VALTDFYGTKANKTNVRGIKVFGNSVTNGILIGAGYGECENADFGLNNTYANPNDPGAAKYLIGWPTYANRAAAVAAGLTSGQEFIATGAANARQIV
jgi:hypothetical protein